jgi:hypothetical protein
MGIQVQKIGKRKVRSSRWLLGDQRLQIFKLNKNNYIIVLTVFSKNESL